MALKLKESVVFKQTGEREHLLDVLGYGCPHVQIYTEKALQKIGSGHELTVVFDNPSSGESITWLCASGGEQILDRQEAGGTFTWKIRKA